jgi:trimeric autotransporter adhesin
MASFISKLFSVPRSKGTEPQRSGRLRRAVGRRTEAALSVQQLEPRLALALTTNIVPLTTTTNPATFAWVIAIDDDPAAGGSVAATNMFMQYTSDGSPYFLIDTSPDFGNAVRLGTSLSGFGVCTTILVTSSNSAFSSGYPGGDLPAVMGPTSGNIAQSFTFQSSTNVPTQRLIVDLSPTGSRIAMNSPWTAKDGVAGGDKLGANKEWPGYQAYGGYLTTGQAALFASEISLASDLSSSSRFSADGSEGRESLFTEPVRSVIVSASASAANNRVRVEGTATTPGLLQLTSSGSMIASATATVRGLGANLQIEGTFSATNQTFLLNGVPGISDPNAYVLTTYSQTTGKSSGNLIASNSIGITLGNPSGGTVTLDTTADRLAFQSGTDANGVPYQYAVTVADKNDLAIDSVGSSSSPISITAGSATTAGSLTISGDAVRTGGDLTLKAFGKLGLSGSVASAAGNVYLQATSLDVGSAVTAGSGRAVYLNSTTGATTADALVRAGGGVKQSVRAASKANSALIGVTGIDGVTLSNGDRVLLKNQSNTKENGIYVFNAGTLTRATDADAAVDFQPGFVVYAYDTAGSQRGGWVFRNPTQPIFAGPNNQTGLSFVPVTAAQVYGDAKLATTVSLTALSGVGMTIDGVMVAAGDRVLVKNQDNKAENGIYVASAGAWTRTGDASTVSTLRAGNYVFVTNGTVQSGTGWVLANDAVKVNTTLLNFQAFTQQLPTTAAYWAPANVLRDVTVATTVDVTLAGSQSVDGIRLTGTGLESVLVKNQIDATKNGIYDVPAAVDGVVGDWTRRADADTGAELPRGTTVYVRLGTQGGSTSWTFDDSARLLGTTTANDAYITGLGTTAGLVTGMLVSGEGIPANTTIVQIRDTTSIRLSTNAILTNTGTPLTFTKLEATVITIPSAGTDTPIAFVPTGGNVTVTAAGNVGGSSRLQGSTALLTAGTASAINAATNVGRIWATAPGAVTLDNSTPVELVSVRSTTAGAIKASADGTLTATSVDAKGVAGTPGNISLTSVFGDVVVSSVSSSLGDVAIKSVNANAILLPAGNVVTTGSVSMTADNGVLTVSGRILAQGTGNDISLLSTNGSIVLNAAANINAIDQLKIFAPVGPITVASIPTNPTIVASRVDWTGPTISSPLGKFSSLAVTLTAPGDINLDVTGTNPGLLTLESASTKDGSITVKANALRVSGSVTTGDSGSGNNDDIVLTATTGSIVVDGNLTAIRDVSLTATNGGVSYTGATATATLGSGATAGQVTGLVVGLGGTGYTSAPAVLVAPPTGAGGTPALVTAVLGTGAQAGIVIGFTVVAAGSGYTAAPTVTIASPNVITAPGKVAIDAKSATNLTTKTARFDGKLSGSGGALTVFETDDLNVGTVTNLGGTVSLVAGSAASGGLLAIDSIDTGTTGSVMLVAGGDVREFNPDAAPDVTGSTATILALTGKVDLDLAVSGNVTTIAATDINLENNGPMVVSRLSSASTDGALNSGKITLKTAGSLTQVGPITTKGLLDATATIGSITLTDPGNDVSNLTASAAGGAIAYTDANGFTVDAGGVTGSNVTLVAGGSGSITQTVSSGAINAAGGLLSVTAGGAVNLAHSANEATTVEIQAPGQAITYRDATGFGIGAAGISGGAVSLAGNGNLTQPVTSGSKIIATSLTVMATAGSVDFQNPANDVDQLSVTNTGGHLFFRDVDDLQIASLQMGAGTATLYAGGALTQSGGITSGSLSVYATGGSIDLSRPDNNVDTLVLSNPDRGITYRNAIGFGIGSNGITGAAVSLTGNGNLTQPVTPGSKIVATTLTVMATAGSVDFQNPANDVDQLSVTNTGGHLFYRDIDDLQIASLQMGAGTATIYAGGALTQSGGITSGSLGVYGTGGSIDLSRGDNNVSTLVLSNPGRGITYRNAIGFGIGSNGITGAAVSLTGNGNLTQPVTPGSKIVATTLTVMATAGSVDFQNPANDVDQLSVTNTGGSLFFTDADGLQITSLEMGAGVAQLIVGGSLTQTGSITSSSLNIYRSAGAVTLANRANSVGTLSVTNNPPGGGDVTFWNAGTFSTTGPITAGTAAAGDGKILLGSRDGSINVNGTLTAKNDSVTLDARNGSFTLVGGAVIDARTLAYDTKVTPTPNPATAPAGTYPAIIAANGDLTISASSPIAFGDYTTTGNITIISSSSVTIDGPLQTSGGNITISGTSVSIVGLLQTTGIGKTVSVTATAGNIGFAGAGSIDNAPTLGGTTTLSATSGTVTAEAGTKVSGATTSLTVGQAVTFPGTIEATTLNAAGAGTAINLTGNNALGTVGIKTASDVVINDTTGSLALSGISATGSVQVTAVGAVTQTGAINGGALSVSANGNPITLNTQSNAVTSFASSNGAGNIAFKDTVGSLALAGITGGTVSIDAAGAVSQQTAGINATALSVNAAGSAITLNTQNNSVTSFASNNGAGNIAFKDTVGTLALAGITGGTVSIDAVGAVTQQTAGINATALSVNAAGSAITLNTQNNSVTSFASNNGAGNIAFKDTVGTLALAGVTGGTVTIDAVGAVSQQTAAINATDLTVNAAGKAITLNTQANTLGSFSSSNAGGSIALTDTSGDLTLNTITSGPLTVVAAGKVLANQVQVTGNATITTANSGGLDVGPLANGRLVSTGQLDLRGVQGPVRLINGGQINGNPILVNTTQAINVGGVITTTEQLNQAVTTVNGLPTIVGSTYEILVGASLVLTQTIVADRPMTLKGTSAAITLNGSATATTGMTINAGGSGSRITSLAFSRFSVMGIQLKAAQNVAISDVTVEFSGTGLSVTGASTGGTVRNNTFNNCPTAISLTSATGLTIGGTATGQPNRINSSARAGVFATGVCTGSSVIRTAFLNTPVRYSTGTSRNLRIVP